MKSKHLLSGALPFILYVLVTVIVFGRSLVPAKNEIIFAPDVIRYHYFQRQFLGQTLKEGIIPWWDPHIESGEPYIEQPQIPIWYIPNLLFVFLPANSAFSWYFAFHIFWAMVGMRWFAKRAIGKIGDIAEIGAWAGGISYGLSAYFMARIYAGHIDIIAASSWLPWVVGAFWILMNQKEKKDQKKSIALAGLLLGLELLSGHQMVAVYTVEAIAIACVIYSITSKSIRPILYSAISVMLGLGVSAIQILPNQQLIAQSIRTINLPQAWSEIATPTVAHLLEFLDPFYFYTKIPQVMLGHEHVGYFGKLPILVALCTVIVVLLKQKRKRDVFIFVCIIIFSLWVWLGSNAPIDLFAVMQKIVPLYSQIRIPSRHIVLFVFSASALFAIGMSMIKNRTVQIFIVILTLVDLVPLGWKNIHIGQIPETREDTTLVTTLTNDTGLYRHLPNFFQGLPLRDILEFDSPIIHNLYSVSGYETPPLRNYWEFLLSVNNLDIAKNFDSIESTPPFANITSPYLDYLNVKYIIVPISSDSLSSDPRRFSLLKENNERGYRLYENKKALPRFYFVPTATYDTRKNIDQILRQGKGDPRKTVFIENNIPNVFNSSGCNTFPVNSVSVKTYQSDKIVLDVEAPCDAFLVSSEVMYPGWQASIDGKKTQLLEGNLAFRTVFVPKGDHTIAFHYFPKVVVVGGLVSMVAIAIFILLVV